METQRQFGRLHLTAWRRLQSKKRLAPCCAVLQRDILRSNEGERTYATRGKETAEKRSIFAPNRTILVLVNFAHVHTGTRDSLHFLPNILLFLGWNKIRFQRDDTRGPCKSRYFSARERCCNGLTCALICRNNRKTSIGFKMDSVNNRFNLRQSKDFVFDILPVIWNGW